MLKTYLVYFVNKDKTELKQLKDFLISLHFKTSKIENYEYEDSYIMGITFKYKTIFELLYLTIITSYFCNIYNLNNTKLLLNKMLCKNFFSIKLIKLFNTILNYKSKTNINNVITSKNILKITITEKDNIIKDLLKEILVNNEHYKNFTYFFITLQNKNKNVKIKTYLLNFVNKLQLKKESKKEVPNKNKNNEIDTETNKIINIINLV